MTAPENQAAVEGTLGSLAGGDQVEAALDPYEQGTVSQDGAIAYSTITYTAAAVDLTEPTKGALEDAAEQARIRSAAAGRLGPPGRPNPDASSGQLPV